MRSFISLSSIISGGQHTHAHTRTHKRSLLPRNSADIIHSEIIYVKPTPHPPSVISRLIFTVSCWVCLPPSVYTLDVSIYINMELYVMYSEPESLNEEENEGPAG